MDISDAIADTMQGHFAQQEWKHIRCTMSFMDSLLLVSLWQSGNDYLSTQDFLQLYIFSNAR